jgi:protein phosphatase 2C-like protein
MKIYTTLQIGEFHTNNCEDYLLATEIGNNKILCAVMDGCTMGTDSYFAETLTGKILRKIAKEYEFKEFVKKVQNSPELLIKMVLKQLFEHFRNFKNQLQLEREETLTTLLIAIVDIAEKSGEFMCIGDGLICIGDQLFEFEQDNRPDYLGYHLNDDFESWFTSQHQKISKTGIESFSLSTDGIFTFKEFDTGTYDKPDNIIDFLLLDEEGSDNSNMLNSKMIEIKATWGLKPTDDLAIIKVIMNK